MNKYVKHVTYTNINNDVQKELENIGLFGK